MGEDHTFNIDILPLSKENSDAAFSLACSVFVDASVLHEAVGVSIKEYREYMRGSFETMRKQELSLVAIDSSTNEIIGCLIACDYTSQVQNPSAIPDTLKPINALLQDLDNIYRGTQRVTAGQCLLVDMAIVSPLARGLSVYSRMREAIHMVGRAVGFTKVVGELSSAATQHVCINKFGHRVCAEIEYASFEYSGRRPFAKIKEPLSIQLVEGELK